MRFWGYAISACWSRAAAVQFLVRHEIWVVSLLPTFLLLALYVCTAVYVSQTHSGQPPKPQSPVRLQVSVMLTCAELTVLVFRLQFGSSNANESAAAAGSNALGAAAAYAVIFSQLNYNLRPPWMLAPYFMTSTILDAAKCICYLQHGQSLLGYLAVATGIIKTVLLMLEEASIRGLLDAVVVPCDAQVQDGQPDISFLALLSNLMGIKGSGASNRNAPLTSESLFQRLELDRRERAGSLMRQCYRALRTHFLKALLLRLIASAFFFAPSFLLRHLLSSLIERDTNHEAKVTLLSLSVGVHVCGPFVKAASDRAMQRIAAALRGSLIRIVHEKNIRSQGVYFRQDMRHLLETDIEAVSKGLPQLVRAVCTVIEGLVGVCFLHFLIGISPTSLLFIILAAPAAAFMCGLLLSGHLELWLLSIDPRSSEVEQMVRQLPAIKASGLGPIQKKAIQDRWTEDIEKFKTVGILEGIASLFRSLFHFAAPISVISFAAYDLYGNGGISAASLFLTLNLATLHSFSLAELVQQLADLCELKAALDNLDHWLGVPDRRDNRTLLAPLVKTPIRYLEPPTDSPWSVPHDPPIIQDGTPCFSIMFSLADVCGRGALPSLAALNFRLQPGSITAVVGERGSGKSSILAAITGDAQISDGTVFVRRDVTSFCGRDPWLRDASIRDNIIAALPYNAKLLNLVMHSCLLHDDVRQLPGGDSYIVGIDGVNLTESQRQKVALARALYMEPSVLLLDDIFSSFDRRTATSILFGLCGEDGLLRKAKCTVVYVTYLTESLDAADQFLSVSGSSARLQLNVRQSHIEEMMQKSHVIKSETAEETTKKTIQKDIAERRTTRAAAHDAAQSPLRSSIAIIFWKFICNVNKASLGKWCLGFIVALGGEIWPAIYVRNWAIDGQRVDWRLFASSTVAIVHSFLCGYLSLSLHYLFSPQLAEQLHEQLLDTIMRATIGFLTTTNIEALSTTYQYSLHECITMLPHAVLQTIYYAPTVMIQLAVISQQSMGTALLAALGMLLLLRSHIRTSRRLRRANSQNLASLHALIRETVTGLRHTRAFGWENFNRERSRRMIEEYQESYSRMMDAEISAQCWMALLVNTVSVVLTAQALFRTSSGSTADAVNTALSLHLVSCLPMSLLKLSKGLNSLDEVGPVFKDLVSLMEKVPCEPVRPHVELPEDWPAAGKITLRNVNAKYDSKLPCAITDVSLSTKPGDNMFIFGRTGCGKSSVLLCILGFLEYTGTIEVDGIDVSTVPLDELRNRLIVVPQQPAFLAGTIFDNVFPGFEPPVPRPVVKAENENIARAGWLEMVFMHLGVFIEINSLGGLHVDARDARLSTRAKAAICFARACVHYITFQSGLVLVDEARTTIPKLSNDNVSKEWKMSTFFNTATVVQTAQFGSGRMLMRKAVVDKSDRQANIEMADGRVIRAQEREPELENDDADGSNTAATVSGAPDEDACADEVPPESEPVPMYDFDTVYPGEDILSKDNQPFSVDPGASDEFPILTPGVHAVPSVYSGSSDSAEPSRFKIRREEEQDSDHEVESACGVASTDDTASSTS